MLDLGIDHQFTGLPKGCKQQSTFPNAGASSSDGPPFQWRAIGMAR
jgi:hypothetical protein